MVYRKIKTLQNYIRNQYIRRKNTIAEIIKLALSRNSKKTAIVYGNTSLSYKELANEVDNTIGFLSDHHLKTGDRVAQVMPDCIESVIFRLACHLSGIEVALIQNSLADESLLHMIRIANPACTFTLEGCNIPKSINSVNYKSRTYSVSPSGFHDPLPQSPATINFSSGSTGLPKGIKLNQANWAASCHAFVRAAKSNNKTQVTYLPMIPLAVAGSTSIIPALLAGMKIIIPEKREPASIAHLIQEQKVNFIFLTPFWLAKLTQTVNELQTDTHTLDKIAVGTDIVHAEIFERAVNVFGPVVTCGYGMAEVLPPLTLLGPEDYVHLKSNDNRWHSVGKPYPHIDISIVDETGNPQPTGKIGNICIHSPSRAQGYIGDNGGDNYRFRSDGYFISEDYGYKDDQGYLFIMGRDIQRLETNAGFRFAREIENICLQHKKVLCACAIQKKRKICIAIYSDVSENDNLIQILKDVQSVLGDTPLEFKIVKDFPETAAGKVDRKKVADLFKER